MRQETWGSIQALPPSMFCTTIHNHLLQARTFLSVPILVLTPSQLNFQFVMPSSPFRLLQPGKQWRGDGWGTEQVAGKWPNTCPLPPIPPITCPVPQLSAPSLVCGHPMPASRKVHSFLYPLNQSVSPPCHLAPLLAAPPDTHTTSAPTTHLPLTFSVAAPALASSKGQGAWAHAASGHSLGTQLLLWWWQLLASVKWGKRLVLDSCKYGTYPTPNSTFSNY